MGGYLCGAWKSIPAAGEGAANVRPSKKCMGKLCTDSARTAFLGRTITKTKSCTVRARKNTMHELLHEYRILFVQLHAQAVSFVQGTGAIFFSTLPKNIEEILSERNKGST